MYQACYNLDNMNDKASVYSNASLFIDDSGIDLHRRTQLQPNVCDGKDEQSIRSDYDINKKETQSRLKSRNNLGQEKSDCCSGLLWNFVILKSKIDLASEVMQLQKKSLVKEAERDVLSRLCDIKMAVMLEEESFHEKSNQKEASSARMPKIIINLPYEEELKITPEESATTLARENMDYTKAGISDLLSEFREAVDGNRCLRRNLKAFKSLNEDIRRRYEEHKSNTEKTLATLGEYVMNTRFLQAECDELQDLLQRSESERKYCMEKLNESRILIEELQLQQRMTEVEETATFFEKKVADMEKQVD